MYSNGVLSALIAGGFGVWVYTKMLRQTGGNTKNTLIGALVSAGVVFLVLVTLLSMFLKN